MRLTAIEHYKPERVVSIEETLDLIRHYSRSYYNSADEFASMLKTAEKLLLLGRFHQVTVRGNSEPFYRNFIEMTRGMLARSGVDQSEIGTVIYCGVARGYLEPAIACQMAAHLGLKKAEFFDVIDACNGWARSTKIADALLRTGAAGKHILLLSLEFGRSPVIAASANKLDVPFHGAYSIRDPSEIEWRLWGATVGEAGTATLLSRDDDAPWYFDYDCECSEFGDCSAALRMHREWDLEPMVLDEVHGGTDFFYAFGRRIGQSIRQHLPPLMRKAQTYLDEASVVVPHTLSSAVYETVFREVGVHPKAVYPFNSYGNCASSGVATGIALALKQGKVKRGERLVLAPTGSGSSAGVISFVY